MRKLILLLAIIILSIYGYSQNSKYDTLYMQDGNLLLVRLEANQLVVYFTCTEFIPLNSGDPLWIGLGGEDGVKAISLTASYSDWTNDKSRFKVLALYNLTEDEHNILSTYAIGLFNLHASGDQIEFKFPDGKKLN